MKDEFTYYLLFSDSTNIPRLSFMFTTEDSNDYLYLNYKLANPSSKLLTYVFAPPVPRNPIMADLLMTPRTVFSEKLKKALEPLNINSIQFIPTQIQDEKRKQTYNNYWGVNIHKEISCVDYKQTKANITDYDMTNIDKVVLDRTILENIPLEDRLIFMLGEHPFDLFHYSIVDKIMESNPTGIQAVNFENYNSDYQL